MSNDWKREIKDMQAVAEPVVTDGIDGNLCGWLEAQAKSHKLLYLLAHADDGVIWGKVDDKGELVTSDGVAPEVSPPLRSETLQQARFFSENAELLLWRDGDNQWHARLIRDAQDGESANWQQAFDEPQMLWGTQGKAVADGFTLMTDGAQGLRHVVPVNAVGDFADETRPLRLIVRQYVQEDDGGFVRVVASRLVKLEVQ